MITHQKEKKMVILDGHSDCGSVDDIRICRENFHGVGWVVSYDDRVYSRYKSHRADFDVDWSIFGVTDRVPFTDNSFIITSDYYINNEKPEEWSYYTTCLDKEKKVRLEKSAELESIFQSLLSTTMKDKKLSYICKLWIKIKSLFTN